MIKEGSLIMCSRLLQPSFSAIMPAASVIPPYHIILLQDPILSTKYLLGNPPWVGVHYYCIESKYEGRRGILQNEYEKLCSSQTGHESIVLKIGGGEEVWKLLA